MAETDLVVQYSYSFEEEEEEEYTLLVTGSILVLYLVV
jgi:hypothetical protein